MSPLNLLPIRQDQIANFADNLATCLAAGVDLRKGVRTSSGALVKAAPEFLEVRNRIDQGESLSEALRVIEHRLPPFVIPVIQCGEQTGRLDQSLRFLAEHCRRLHRPSEAIRNAWLLPLVILIGGKVLAVGVMFLFGSWTGTGGAIGNLIATCGSIAAIAVILYLTPIKLLFDQAKLLIPIIGSVERELAVNRFLHVFSLLYGSGGHRVEKMIRHACQTVTNEWLRRDLLRMAVQIERGQSLPDAFDRTATFTRDEKSELAAGELAGRLAETCARIADRVGESAAFKLTRITRVATRITMAMVMMSLTGTILPLLLFRSWGG